MTSSFIDTFRKRRDALQERTQDKTDCVFCRIIAGDEPATRIYEDEKVLAILDIFFIRPGHTLVFPKAHYSRLSDLPEELAKATGAAVARVAHALTKALNNSALNVVCNQEYAQVVPHVHWHIVPAPKLASLDEVRPLLRKEILVREELDRDESEKLARQIRSKL